MELNVIVALDPVPVAVAIDSKAVVEAATPLPKNPAIELPIIRR
jgi:hypothetical protein